MDDTFVRLLYQTLDSFISVCSFYYVNWDDPIYDQFDDYMEKLEQEEEKAKQDQRSKGTVRLNYKVGRKHWVVSYSIWNFFSFKGAAETVQTTPTWTSS